MILSVMAPAPCLPPWTWPPDWCSEKANPATAIRSFSPCHPPTPQGSRLAGAAPRYHMHYTPHLCLLAQSAGTLVWSHHPVRDSPWFVHQRPRSGRENRCLRAALQSFESSLGLDRDGRFDPAENRPTLFTTFRDTTLAPSSKEQKARS